MLNNKIIGIWGLGMVGKSALDFFTSHQHKKIVVMNTAKPDEQTFKYFNKQGITYFDQQKQAQKFLDLCDIILPSPGIDLRPYSKYQNKWTTEADLFALYWHKPIIAITGTLGKTTITHVLSEQLKAHGLAVATGGNIGTPMLSLINDQNNFDSVVLELSSFQLEYAKTFAPDLAIITNLYPNHLDRHNNLASYWQAKQNIFINQQANQKLLIPLYLKEHIIPSNNTILSTINYVSDHTPEKLCDPGYYIDKHNNIICIQKAETQNQNVNVKTIVLAQDIPKSSFAINWLITAAALDLYGIKSKLKAGPSLEHRLSHIATINKIDFYNDSKATVMEATLSAIDSFKGHPIILILGGLSKGVNRQKHIENLKAKIKHIICFGDEAQNLSAMCIASHIPNTSYSNLKESVAFAKQLANPYDIVLFSPGGASFDRYKNYQERGNHFNLLIKSKNI